MPTRDRPPEKEAAGSGGHPKPAADQTNKERPQDTVDTGCMSSVVLSSGCTSSGRTSSPADPLMAWHRLGDDARKLARKLTRKRRVRPVRRPATITAEDREAWLAEFDAEHARIAAKGAR